MARAASALCSLCSCQRCCHAASACSRSFQRRSRAGFGAGEGLGFRFTLAQAPFELGDPFAVAAGLAAQFGMTVGGFLTGLLQALAQLAVVPDLLLDAGDIGANLVAPRLHLVQCFAGFLTLLTAALELGLDLALLGQMLVDLASWASLRPLPCRSSSRLIWRNSMACSSA